MTEQDRQATIEYVEREKARMRTQREVDASLIRDILEALCVREGISLDSTVEPGTSARNYELALRLGIGDVFGLPAASSAEEDDR